MRKYFIISLTIFALLSCSEYQKLLKSNDPELKYEKAVVYFEKKDYMRATTLFDEVTRYYRGTERSELILNYLAQSYMGQKDYFTAGEYYKTYVRTYPKGKFIAEARYMIGYCFYLDSPDARLDQTSTMDAIESFNEFLDLHPDNERVPKVNELLDELLNKLAYKELLSARLYYNLGSYLGNNYLSAVVVSENALEDFPANNYREEFAFIILKSKYQQALQSVEDKRVERYRETIDEYYNYANEFPAGKNIKEANKILADSQKIVKD